MVARPDSLTRWVLKAQDRSQEAFAVLVAETEAHVLARLRRYGFSPHDSEDIAAVTYLECWTKLPLLRDPERFRGWLLALLRGFASDARRRLNTEERHVAKVGDAFFDEAEAPGRGASDRHLREIVGVLDESDRCLLEQKYLSRMTLREIAARSGLQIHHVAHRLRRIKQELRARWLSAAAPAVHLGDHGGSV